MAGAVGVINGKIVLQPNSNVKYKFKFPPAEVADGPGSIPYGTTVSSVDVTVYNSDGTDVGTSVLVSDALANNNVVCKLKYSSTWGEGRYKITFVLTLSDADTLEYDFQGLYLEDK